MNFRRQYSGEAKVKFDCVIERGNLHTLADITFPAEVDGGMTVQLLRDEMAAVYDLPGRISLHLPNGEELNDDFAYIGDIIATDKFVRLRYDETVPVANGAIAQGGRAFASGGRRAFAAGGFAGGGSFLPDGTAAGGLGRGGHVWADYGEAGSVLGGSANSPGGKARAGDKYAGKVFRNHVDAGVTEKNEMK